jgi:hypothetical protein
LTEDLGEPDWAVVEAFAKLPARQVECGELLGDARLRQHGIRIFLFVTIRGHGISDQPVISPLLRGSAKDPS